MSFEVVPFPNAEILARTAAEAWIAALKAPAEGPPYSVGLAGGRIAARFFSELTKLETATRAALNSVHFFWGDERCVPPEDPESNFGLAKRLLFIALSVPENQIHRIRGEEPPEQAALEAEKELRAVAVEQTRGQPVLDMVFLGMGEDGHVASLFPGESEALVASPAVYRPVIGPKPPPHRITLGFPAIAAARDVWVLASGAEKERALRESLSPDGRTPLARVLKMRSQTQIWTDIPVGR